MRRQYSSGQLSSQSQQQQQQQASSRLNGGSPIQQQQQDLTTSSSSSLTGAFQDFVSSSGDLTFVIQRLERENAQLKEALKRSEDAKMKIELRFYQLEAKYYKYETSAPREASKTLLTLNPEEQKLIDSLSTSIKESPRTVGKKRLQSEDSEKQSEKSEGSGYESEKFQQENAGYLNKKQGIQEEKTLEQVDKVEENGKENGINEKKVEENGQLDLNGIKENGNHLNEEEEKNENIIQEVPLNEKVLNESMLSEEKLDEKKLNDELLDQDLMKEEVISNKEILSENLNQEEPPKEELSKEPSKEELPKEEFSKEEPSKETSSLEIDSEKLFELPIREAAAEIILKLNHNIELLAVHFLNIFKEFEMLKESYKNQSIILIECEKKLEEALSDKAEILKSKMDVLKLQSQFQLTWVPDDCVKECLQCGQPFSFFVRQVFFFFDYYNS